MEAESLFLTQLEQERVVRAIKEAELQTSGEIKVYIEGECPDPDPVVRAVFLFDKLNMSATRERNGVLFYLAHEDHKFAVIGDQGIYSRTHPDFWDSTKELLRENFKRGAFAEGLSLGIGEAGLQLKKYFPYQSDDVNELPDDIVFG